MSDERTEIFDNIYLGDSWLLGIETGAPPFIALRGLFHVLDDHPEFDGKQEPEHWACYREGRIIIENPSEDVFSDQNFMMCYSTDACDLGEFRSLTFKEGRVLLEAQAFTLRCKAHSVKIELAPRT